MSMFINPVMQAVLYQGGYNLWSNGFWKQLGHSIHDWFDDDDRRRAARVLPECPSIDTAGPLVYSNECIFSASSGESFLVARDLEFATRDAVTIVVDNYVECADACSEAVGEGCVGFELRPEEGGERVDCQLKLERKASILPSRANRNAPEKMDPSNGSGTKFTPGGRSRARTKSTSGHMRCGGSVLIGNSTFNVGCSYEFYGVPMPGSVVHEVPLRRCLEACEQDANCRAVSFLEKRPYESLDEAAGSCVFQSSVVAGRQLPEEEGGRLIGAYKEP